MFRKARVLTAVLCWGFGCNSLMPEKTDVTYVDIQIKETGQFIGGQRIEVDQGDNYTLAASGNGDFFTLDWELTGADRQSSGFHDFDYGFVKLGEYHLSLTVVDVYGRTAATETWITVVPKKDGGQPPPDSCTAAIIFQFDAGKALGLSNCVLASDGTITAHLGDEIDIDVEPCLAGGVKPFTFDWHEGTVPRGSSAKCHLVCDQEGRREFLITVADSCGKLTTKTVVVIVVKAAATGPCLPANQWVTLKAKAPNGNFTEGTLNWQPAVAGGTVDVTFEWEYGPGVLAIFTQATGLDQLVNQGPLSFSPNLPSKKDFVAKGLGVGNYAATLTIYCGGTSTNSVTIYVNIEPRTTPATQPSGGGNGGGGQAAVPQAKITWPPSGQAVHVGTTQTFKFEFWEGQPPVTYHVKFGDELSPRTNTTSDRAWQFDRVMSTPGTFGIDFWVTDSLGQTSNTDTIMVTVSN